jgi:hypothetical protein
MPTMGRAGDIPDDVATAIDAYIDSLAGLEILVAVARDPSRTWTAERAATQIGVTSGIAKRDLDRFVQLGLLRQDATDPPTYVFQPADAERAGAVARLDAYYRTYRVTLINHVASRALKQIQALADAFRLGRKKGEP